MNRRLPTSQSSVTISGTCTIKTSPLSSAFVILSKIFFSPDFFAQTTCLLIAEDVEQTFKDEGVLQQQL